MSSAESESGSENDPDTRSGRGPLAVRGGAHPVLRQPGRLQRCGPREPTHVLVRGAGAEPGRPATGSPVPRPSGLLPASTQSDGRKVQRQHVLFEEELAFVLGHELAHHILGHTNQPRTFERTEAEADYLGLYLAARAGYDLGVAPEVWDDFARISPFAAVDWASTPIRCRRSAPSSCALPSPMREWPAGRGTDRARSGYGAGTEAKTEPRTLRSLPPGANTLVP